MVYYLRYARDDSLYSFFFLESKPFRVESKLLFHLNLKIYCTPNFRFDITKNRKGSGCISVVF